MASRVVCNCGHMLRKNLGEGHGLHLLVPEELTERPLDTTFGYRITAMIRQSALVITSPMCEGLTVELPDGSYRSYALLKEAPHTD